MMLHISWRRLVSVAATTLALSAGISVAEAHAAPDVIAHRGMGTSTSSSYWAAARERADVLEGDVQITKDNRFVISHDATLHRGGKRCSGKKIKTLTAGQVRRCDPKVIPLKTLVDIGKRTGVRLSLEMKVNGGKSWTKKRMRKFRSIVEARGMQRRTTVYSFSPAVATRFRGIGTHGIRTGLNTQRPVSIATARATGNDLVMPLSSVSESLVQWYHANGVRLSIYTTRTDEQDRAACELGVDGIVTDRAGATRKVVAAAEMRSEDESS